VPRRIDEFLESVLFPQSLQEKSTQSMLPVRDKFYGNPYIYWKDLRRLNGEFQEDSLIPVAENLARKGDAETILDIAATFKRYCLLCRDMIS
jgi:hypothetical protein